MKLTPTKYVIQRHVYIAICSEEQHNKESTVNITILGGGIGGLSTAIALKQNGFDVTVYERAPQPSNIGAGIVCWPNASFVLEQLGLLEAVANVSGSINYMNRYTDTGQPIGSLNINELNKLMNYKSYSILRKDLLRILLERTVTLNIDIHYDHEVTNITEGTLDSVIYFRNGERISPDLIIGADGRMRSVARKYVNGNNQPIYQGFINWVGVYEHPSSDFADLTISDYWGQGTRFGIVPISKTKAYWAGGTLCEKVGLKEPEYYKSELNALFSSWPEPIPRIINQSHTPAINKIYVHDHDPIATWHRNNVVLLGDAAHSPLPTSGQGACQALEDAWHLSNCLKNSDGNLSYAINTFTELRKTKTSGITMTGRQLASSIFNRDSVFCRQRNLASKQTNYSEAVFNMAKGWSSGLPLPLG